MKNRFLAFSRNIVKSKLFETLYDLKFQIDLIEKDMPENAKSRLESLEKRINDLDKRLSKIELVLFPISFVIGKIVKK